MNYFKYNGKIIEKYHVTFEKEEVEKLKEEIIQNCSFINHQEFESDYDPVLKRKMIKNFHKTYVGEKDYFEETRKVYLYSYDEYTPPYLVKLIDLLLQNDIKGLEAILSYDLSPNSSIDEQIHSVTQEFIKIDNNQFQQKKEKLKELEELLKLKELNKYQKGIDFYYNRLMQCIHFEWVNSLPMDEQKKVEDFFEKKFDSILIHDDPKDKKQLKKSSLL